MAISFKPLKLDDAELFGVRVEGSVGRSDRSLLQELADKCLARAKTQLILDFSELETIGGGGAATLADFQRNLIDQGGEAVFAGVADLVHKFLVQKFDDLPLRCYPSVDDAVTDFHARAQATEVEAAIGDQESPEATPPPPDSAASETDREDDHGGAASVDPAGSDRDLDSLLGGYQGNAAAAADPAAGSADSVDPIPEVGDGKRPESTADAAPAAGAQPTPAPRTSGEPSLQFLSLDEAVAALRAAADGNALRDSLARLLRGYGLADEVTYFIYEDGCYISSDGAWSIAADGPLAYELAGADRPLSLLDITQDLGEEDTLPLAELQPDLILPVVWDQTLQAIAFLKRAADQEHEYEVSEHFALELVMRLLADHGGRGRQITDEDPASDIPSPSDGEDSDEACAAQPADDREALREPAVLPTLLGLARDLPVASESERFWKLFVERASGLFFVQSLIYLEPEHPDLPAACLGRARSGVAQLDLSDERLAKYFANLQRPVQAQNMPASFESVRENLERFGINWIANLSVDQQRLGVLLLGIEPRIERDDQTDLIEEVLAVTNEALALLRDRQHSSDLRCDLLKTVIGLYERHDHDAAERTALMARLLQALAGEVDFPVEQRRELLCGVLLCDIGRIEREGSIAAAAEDLDEDGQQQYRRHPETGAELLEQLRVSPTVTEVVLCHHERFDGSGFPRQLQGREIPLAARIVAVVENYAALVIGDSDKPGLDSEAAAQALRGDDPGRLDPEIIGALLSILDEAEVPVGAT